eukprot:scaffold300_cov258-Pinguiococcus_pyrenoidosus.AAC.4
MAFPPAGWSRGSSRSGLPHSGSRFGAALHSFQLGRLAGAPTPDSASSSCRAWCPWDSWTQSPSTLALTLCRWIWGMPRREWEHRLVSQRPSTLSTKNAYKCKTQSREEGKQEERREDEVQERGACLTLVPGLASEGARWPHRSLLPRP